MKLNINTDAAVKFTNILEKIGKNALPDAVRGALNKTAFDVKMNTMPTKASSTFVNRTKNFFRANSSVDMASGRIVNNMKSTVGFFSNNLKGADNYAVKDLEQQEYSGSIGGKTFIPTVYARKGGTVRGLVKPNLRLKKIREKGIIVANDMRGKNAKENYILATIKAGVGGFVLYNKILWRIDSLPVHNIKTKRLIVKRTPVYSVKAHRSVRVKATNFMKSATLQSNLKMEGFFIAEAEKQINKLR